MGKNWEGAWATGHQGNGEPWMGQTFPRVSAQSGRLCPCLASGPGPCPPVPPRCREDSAVPGLDPGCPTPVVGSPFPSCQGALGPRGF